MFNQAFFTHLYIDEEGIHSEYAEPFDVLLGEAVLEAGRASLEAEAAEGEAGQTGRAEGVVTMAEILGRPGNRMSSQQQADPQGTVCRWGSACCCFTPCLRG